MNPVLTAIQEPHLWNPGPPVRGKLVVHHPNGAELSATRSEYGWFIRDHTPSRSPILAEIPKESRRPAHAGWIEDTQRVLGPDVRAQLDALMLDIRRWMAANHGSCQRACVKRHLGTVFLPQIDKEVRLPKSMTQRAQDLRRVMRPNASGRKFIQDSVMFFDMPTSMHARLALVAQYRAAQEIAST